MSTSLTWSLEEAGKATVQQGPCQAVPSAPLEGGRVLRALPTQAGG